MTFWSPDEIAQDTLYVVVDTHIDGYDPAGGSEFSVVTGTLIYERVNDILRALASFWTCGPLPCEIKLVPQNFALPVVGGKCLYSRIPQT